MPTAALMLAAGCSESDVQDLFTDNYHKIIYIKDAGDKNVTLYVTGSDVNYSFKVCKGGSNPALSAAGRIEVMSQAQVDEEYSIPYGETYKVLTSDAYTLNGADVEFGTADMAKTVDVSLKVNRVKTLTDSDPDALWVLPLRLVSDRDSVNADNNSYVIIVDKVSEPLVGFKKSGVEEFTCDISEPFSIKVPVSLIDVDNIWNLTGTIGIDNQFLSDYNRDNGTAHALPDINYSVCNSFELKSDRQEAIVEVSVPDFGTRTSGSMMIPLKITGVSMFSVSAQHAHYAALLKLTGHKFDRSNWIAKACSEQAQEQFDWGTETASPAQNVLDGDINTMWHYKYGSKGEGSCGGHDYGKHCIMIDMKSKHTLTQIGLVQRAGGEWNILKSVRFWVSNDDAVWNANASEKAGWQAVDGVYTMTEDTDQREHVFDIPASEGRYLKVEVVESLKGGDVGAFAEIFCYGK